MHKKVVKGTDREPSSPLRDVLIRITGATPPDFVGRGVFSTIQLSERENEQLQWWCAEHAFPVWLSGIGIMDAADKLVEEAVANGNISPQEWYTDGTRLCFGVRGNHESTILRFDVGSEDAARQICNVLNSTNTVPRVQGA